MTASEMVRFEGGLIERMGAAEVEDFDDIAAAATILEIREVGGYAPYTALYRIEVDGAELHYLVAEPVRAEQ
jgi:hypothetical protein